MIGCCVIKVAKLGLLHAWLRVDLFGVCVVVVFFKKNFAKGKKRMHGCKM